MQRLLISVPVTLVALMLATGCARSASDARVEQPGEEPRAVRGEQHAEPLGQPVGASPSDTPALGAGEQREGPAATGELAMPQPAEAEPARRSCGVCYAHNWQEFGANGYGSETSAASLRELSDIGVRSLSYTDFGWMRSVNATTIRSSTSMPGAETMQRMRDDIAEAHDLGMTTMLKPHIWIGRGEWRGDIAPAGGDWASWFASYRAFLLPRAEFAESVGAEWFVIGVELVSATRGHDEQWRSLIADIRAVYSGKLTYAANWDEVQQVLFWDALDAVGVQMFAPLLLEGEPATLDAMTAGAQRWLAEYEAIAERVQRPLILTEAGVLNRAGGARTPWVWPEAAERAATTTGDEEQAMYYRAIAGTFGESALVEQIYWWKWFTNPSTNEEGPVGFSPRGKPAEQVLRDLCAER